MTLTKQNITELIYKTTLINNTDLQQSEALTELIVGVYNQFYTDPGSVQNAINAGNITYDTYIMYSNNGSTIVDTAKRILQNNGY